MVEGNIEYIDSIAAVVRGEKVQAVKADEDTGLAQLRVLSLTEMLEAMWAFIPRINEWRNVNKESGNGIAPGGFRGTYSETNTKILRSLAKEYGELHVYHSHTLPGLLKGGEPYPASFAGVKKLMQVHAASGVPTDGDIIVAHTIHLMIDEAPITSGVIHPYGVTTYQLDDSLKPSRAELEGIANAIYGKISRPLFFERNVTDVRKYRGLDEEGRYAFIGDAVERALRGVADMLTTDFKRMPRIVLKS
ncbi:hypothetical protein HYU16_04215 [Candidatus Woesearchaeota archaeon]|nr:hypothetical protein [Candidatus Woesearchaeota archaeon]